MKIYQKGGVAVEIKGGWEGYNNMLLMTEGGGGTASASASILS
jgi:hypothetical protein